MLDDERRSAFEGIFNEMKSIVPNTEISVTQTILSRSLREVSQGTVDFHYPFICTELTGKPGEFLRFGSTPYGQTAFVFITRRSNDLTAENLFEPELSLTRKKILTLSHLFSKEEKEKLLDVEGKRYTQKTFVQAVSSLLDSKLSEEQKAELLRAAFPYSILVARSVTNGIRFPSEPVNSLDNALRMVASGRADAVVDSYTPAKIMFDKMKLQSTLEIRFLKYYPICYIVKKGEHGDQIDRILGEAFTKLESTESSKFIREVLERKETEFFEAQKAKE
jgi:ABC-type amino acid transport substrate-binding protein